MTSQRAAQAKTTQSAQPAPQAPAPQKPANHPCCICNVKLAIEQPRQ
jgi:hypothetical protein